MYFISWLWLTFMCVSLFIGIHTLLLLTKQKKHYYYHINSAMAFNVFIWTGCEFIQNFTSVDQMVLFAHEFKYMAILTIPTLLYVYSKLINSKDKIPPKTLMVIIGLPIVFMLLIVTNPLHHLFRVDFEIIRNASMVLVAPTNGILFYLIILYTYALIFITLLNFIKAFRNQPSNYKTHELTLIISIIIPMGLNTFFHSATFLADLNFDPTPIGFFISICIYYYYLVFYKVNNSLIKRRGYLMDYLSEGILILDQYNCITDANAKFLELSELTIEQLHGKPISTLEDDFFKHLNYQISHELVETEFKAEANSKYHYYKISYKDAYNPKQKLLGTIVTITNITDYKNKLLKLDYLTTHDTLTDLHNRAFFNNQIKVLNDYAYFPLGLAYCTVSNLKQINDMKGHHAGDNLLINIAKRLLTIAPPNGIVSRTGSDEFTILVPNTTRSDMSAMAATIEQLLNTTNDNSLKITYAIKTDDSITLSQFKRVASN